MPWRLVGLTSRRGGVSIGPVSLQEETARRLRQTGLLVTIPIALAAGPGAGFVIGDYLDRMLGTGPWLMIVFILLGAAAGVRQTLVVLVRAGSKA